MKIVVQNFKTGELSLGEAPVPRPHPRGVLVRVSASLISSGTDRAVIALARKGYVGKALDRPDLARKVINKARTDGLWSTYKVVKNLIAEPIPLGYSLVGEVVAIAPGIHDLAIGGRVACAGLGHANHAEFVAVPANLTVPVPRNVSDGDAAYATLGAIAMHGVRQADQQFGGTVLVVGLGLVGLLSVKLCVAAGLRVIGLDVDERKLDLARASGVLAASTPADPNLNSTVRTLTHGIGVDAVLVTAASRDSGAILDQVAPFCRDRARVVIVGDVKIELSRRAYFEKELEILQSRSYGPGRYDPSYEEGGNDYPVGYVRWTERRNMQAFIDLLADGRLDLGALTTHRFPFSQAMDAYRLITEGGREPCVGILLDYGETTCEPEQPRPPALAAVRRTASAGTIGLGVIGTGQFAKAVLLPALMGTGGFRMVGVASARGLSAEAVRGRYGADYATTDATRVLDDEAVEAVVIASRHDSHARYVKAALDRGKHVYVEKPLCLTTEELDEIRTACTTSPGVLFVGFNRRFSPLVGLMRDHFKERSEPLAMLYRVNAGRILLRSEQSWVHDCDVGGGRIIGEACHFVDTMQAVCGARPQSVHVVGSNPGRADLAGNDIVTFTIAFDDGSIGTVHYWGNGDTSYPKERFEAFGQERIAVLDNFRSLDLVAAGSTKRHRRLNVDKGYWEEAAAFRDACRSGRAPVTPEVLFDTMATVIAAQAGLENGFDLDNQPD